MTSEPIVQRPVSRVVLLDDEDRVLLFDTVLGYTRVWMAPGGALEPEESYEDAALRELEEETGLILFSLGPCVWYVQFRFVHGSRTYHQTERYFLARIASHDVKTEMRTATEASEIRESRWWRLDEVRASSASFRPANAATLLTELIAGRYPPKPVIAPVERTALTA